MAVLVWAFLLLVVMPFLIYVSVAWVMRAAGLVRAKKGVPLSKAEDVRVRS